MREDRPMRGGAHNIQTHTCDDGQVRRIEPLYVREVNPETDKRFFRRFTWYCGHCGNGPWRSE